MPEERTLKAEEFNALLAALTVNGEDPGQAYEAVRRRLILFFSARGLHDPEFAADDTLDRVARRIGDFVPGGPNSLNRFIYAFANNVRLEYYRQAARHPLMDEAFLPEIGVPAAEIETAVDLRFECLMQCLNEIPTEERDLLLEYYSRDGMKKIELRKKISTREGISTNNLHTRIYRIRERIKKKIHECLRKK